jgi:hypothetical protein
LIKENNLRFGRKEWRKIARSIVMGVEKRVGEGGRVESSDRSVVIGKKIKGGEDRRLRQPASWAGKVGKVDRRAHWDLGYAGRCGFAEKM